METRAPVSLLRGRRFKWGAGLVATSCAAAVLILWLVPSRQSSGAPGAGASDQLTARGYIDAPAGTAVVGGNPWTGGDVIVELRIKNDQEVKRGEIIAVLSNYDRDNISVRIAEAKLQKAERLRETMISGYRAATIGLEEIVVKTMAEQAKLKALELTRSDGPPDVKRSQADIAQTNLEREQMRLKVMKETLASDLAQSDADLKIFKADLEKARSRREQALVRAPLDGVVVKIYGRPGERIGPSGIAKIVDMSQMRVIADMDERLMGRAHVGAKVDVTFRGSADTYPGKVSRIVPIVKRMQRIEPDGGVTTDTPVVQVEIELDNSSHMPPILGREAKVVFP